MIGSLTSGVQAMSSFVKGIEVIGNNISNVNTVGFKSATTRFQDTFSNTLQRGTGNTGLGSNSITQQIGTGSKIATIKTQFSQGSLQTTGGLSDLGVSGEGFFRVRDTLQGLEYVTRAGDFRVDDQGYLVTNTGFRVQGIGIGADTVDGDANGVADGEFTTSATLDYANLVDIRIDYRNSDAAAPRMETFQIDQGGNVNIFLSDGTSMVRGKILLQRFQDTGALVKEGDNLYSGIADAGPTAPWPDSRAPGSLSAAFGTATDYEALSAAQNGNGRIISGSLEMSNVDLTNEFAGMITTQRAFQAASKLITTSDEILQDIVNLKR
ncbi:MAG: flagellar hook-basal body complex protein [Opitutaceae bacterium]